MKPDTIKKDVQALFATLREDSIHGSMPAKEKVIEFQRLCTQMQMSADEEWRAEVDDLCQLANKLLQGCNQSNLEDAILTIDSLDESMKFCQPFFEE